MVHALQQVHQLLRPQGWLVNLLDLPVPAVIEVHAAGAVTRVGWMLDRGDFLEERSTLNALAQVVGQGDYILEAEQDFVRNFHVDSLAEFNTWLVEKLTSALLPGETAQRLAALLRQAAQPSKIVVAARSRITKIRAV
jgi:hypothetical protein